MGSLLEERAWRPRGTKIATGFMERVTVPDIGGKRAGTSPPSPWPTCAAGQLLGPGSWLGAARAAHLVDEGGELVVQGLDLLALLLAHLLDGGVDVHLQWGQQALVDGDLADAGARWVPVG